MVEDFFFRETFSRTWNRLYNYKERISEQNRVTINIKGVFIAHYIVKMLRFPGLHVRNSTSVQIKPETDPDHAVSSI